MKRKKITLPIIALCLIVTTVAFVVLFKTGILKSDPKVTIEAENCYNETLTVVLGNDYAPFSFEKDGQYIGYDVELANELANRLKKNVDIQFYSWTECLSKMQSGEADLIMSVDYEMPIDGISYSYPISSNPWYAFTVDVRENIYTYADLRGKQIGIGAGTNPLVNTDLTHFYVEFETYEQAFEALENEDVDVVITQYHVGTLLASREEFSNINADCEINRGNLAVGVKSDEKLLLLQINQHLSNMSKDGTLKQLDEKWCKTYIRHYSLKDLWETNPEFFAVSGFAIFSCLLLLISLSIKSVEERKEAKLKEKLEFQSQLIKHLIQEYSEIYFVHMYDEKEQDTSQSIFKGGILAEDVFPSDDSLPFTNKLDYFIDNIVYSEDRNKVFSATRREEIIKNIQDNDMYVVSFRTFRNDELHHYQMRFAKVSTDEKTNGFVIGLRLVDEEARVLEQLEKEKQNAEAANKAKTSFLFNMSHDIRTPMNAITGFTDMAEKNLNNPEKVIDCLKKTKQAGNLLLSLINSVLEMSRIEAGKAELDEKPWDVSYSFLDIESTMRALADEKNIKLSFEFGTIKDYYVYVDIDRSNRILTNIISNAIKYTNNGGQVKVKCEQLQRHDEEYGLYKYTITDNGIGMSEEFLGHIFDEFSRESNTTRSGIQGSGLGLSVAKSFIDLMNGTIEVESKQGEGSTFTIVLPFRLQLDEAGPSCIHPVTREIVDVSLYPKRVANTDKPVLEGRRVLLVEDNELNREIATFMLEEQKMVVEEAEDGRVAVDILAEKGQDYFDLVLMDIQMPIMNGYEATRAIRAMYPQAKLPIIALSANAFAEDKVASLEAGMNDHIAKPINTAELISTISKYL